MKNVTIVMSEEERYNNRQIERFFDDQSREIKEHISLVINPLTTQVMKTNGTVKWQTKLLYVGIGALMILTPWAAWVTTTLLSQEKPLTKDDIESIIDSRLVDY